MTQEEKQAIRSRRCYLKQKSDPRKVEKRRESWRAWYRRQDKKKFESRKRDQNYLKRYGIALSEYNRMFAEQGGRCLVCGGNKMPRGHKHLAVDHSHSTGQVRGLLCWTCNVGLGWYERNADAVHSYLAPNILRLISGGK